MVQMTFTTSLIAAVVACAYFAEASPVAGFRGEIEPNEGFLSGEARLYGDEVRPFGYEPYGNRYYNGNRGDRGFEIGELRDIDLNRGGLQNDEFLYRDQRPNRYFQDTEVDDRFRKSRLDAEREEVARRELQESSDFRAYSDRSRDNRAEVDARRDTEVAGADKARDDRNFQEQYDTEFDKSAYELGYGYDKGVKYDKGYGYSRGYNQEFEKQFDQIDREDAEAAQFRAVRQGYENFRESEVRDKDERDLAERLRLQREREARRDDRFSGEVKENEFRLGDRRYAQEQPRTYGYRNGPY